MTLTDDVILTLRYPEYERKLPEFINETHQEMFTENPQYCKLIGRRNTSYFLNGVIEFYRGGKTAIPWQNSEYECGQRTNASHFKGSFHERGVPIVRRRTTAAAARDANVSTIDLTIVSPLLVPDSMAFQHFLDGVLPKLAQLTPFLRHPNLHFIMFKPRDPIIYELMHAIGIEQRRITYISTPVNTEYQLNTCVTPPTHPRLMRQSRRLLGVAETLQTNMTSAYVVLLTR